MTAVGAMVRPSWATPRDASRRSFGPVAGELAAELGQPLLPWQQMVADVALEVDDDGRLAYRRVVLTTPRQSGKTTLLRSVMLQRSAVGRDVRYTAQTRAKAVDLWAKMLDGVAGQLNPVSGPRRVQFTDGKSNERFRWLGSRGMIRPFTPDDQGLHGESPDDVMVDEVQAFDLVSANKLQGAFGPSQSARRDPQVWFTSTAGDRKSEWLQALVAAGRRQVEAGESSRTAFFEWSIPDQVGGVRAEHLPDDDLLALIFDRHPGYGITLNREVVLGELDDVHNGVKSRAEFIRAYGNLPTGASAAGGLWAAAVWDQASTDLAPVGDVGFGIDVDPDGREWSLVAAGRATSGQTVVEVIVRRDGAPGAADVAYVRDRVATSRPVSTFMIGAGAAEDFADELESGGVTVERISAADLGAATSRMHRGVEQLQILHRGQPSLTDAQRAAKLRESGGRRLMARAGTAGISAVQAGMLAAWALDHPADAARGPFRIFTPRSA